METLKGYTLEIYRSDYDCNINKMYGKKVVTLIDPRSPQIFEASEDAPPVKLLTKNVTGKEYLYALPIEGGNYAFGGTFIYTSDSRINAISKYPIPLHDRQMDLE